LTVKSRTQKACLLRVLVPQAQVVLLESLRLVVL
jgi:hypothetical protein